MNHLPCYYRKLASRLGLKMRSYSGDSATFETFDTVTPGGDMSNQFHISSAFAEILTRKFAEADNESR